MGKINDEQVVAIMLASIVIVILAVFTLLFFLLFIKKKTLLQKKNEQIRRDYENQLLQSQIEVQESTFSALGKELHDNIGQLLSTAKMLLGITERNLSNPPDTLITANETVGQAISEIRSLSKSLNKEWLEQFDLIDNLVMEVNRINSADDIKIYLAYQDKINLEPDKQIILFRIIQEAIQNTLKHAYARNIYIRIDVQDGVLLTTVKDDGTGFQIPPVSNGVGMVNMKQRIKLLGGIINWDSSSSGSTVTIQLPLK